MLQQKKHVLPISIIDVPLHWSKFEYGMHFEQSYDLVRTGGTPVVGCAELCPDRFHGNRFLHWECAGGIICLKEWWIEENLVDNAICLQLGEIYHESPLSIYVTSDYIDDCIRVTMSFAMNDGCIIKLILEIMSPNASLLAEVVDEREGKLIQGISDLNDGKRFTLSWRNAQHQNVTFNCSTFLSHSNIVFGSTDGQLLSVRILPNGNRVETKFSHENNIFNFIHLTNKAAKSSIVSITGHFLDGDSFIIAAYNDGHIRLWSGRNRYCLNEIAIKSLYTNCQLDIASGCVQDLMLASIWNSTESTSILVAIAVSTALKDTIFWKVHILLFHGKNLSEYSNVCSLSMPHAKSPVSLQNMSFSSAGSGLLRLMSSWCSDREVIIAYHEFPLAGKSESLHDLAPTVLLYHFNASLSSFNLPISSLVFKQLSFDRIETILLQNLFRCGHYSEQVLLHVLGNLIPEKFRLSLESITKQNIEQPNMAEIIAFSVKTICHSWICDIVEGQLDCVSRRDRLQHLEQIQIDTAVHVYNELKTLCDSYIFEFQRVTSVVCTNFSHMIAHMNGFTILLKINDEIEQLPCSIQVLFNQIVEIDPTFVSTFDQYVSSKINSQDWDISSTGKTKFYLE